MEILVFSKAEADALRGRYGVYSALDPVATLRVEELMRRLTETYTIVIVTHNMQQAARASHWTGFFWLGELVEFNKTDDLFAAPKEELTEAYITGRRG